MGLLSNRYRGRYQTVTVAPSKQRNRDTPARTILITSSASAYEEAKPAAKLPARDGSELPSCNENNNNNNNNFTSSQQHKRLAINCPTRVPPTTNFQTV